MEADQAEAASEKGDKPMTVIVCGSRDWTDEAAIRRALMWLGRDVTVVHGDCRGADRIAGKIAKECGHTVWTNPADWAQHGRSAGPRRNAEMLNREPRPSLVLALHDDLDASSGTCDMVIKAHGKGVPVIVVASHQPTVPA